jgi:formamidopyrimidine-DNA glycosylase
MPELPEVESLARYLEGQMAGRRIASLEMRSFAALKTADPQPVALVGRVVVACRRHGKFLAIGTVDGTPRDGGTSPDPDLHLVIHFARAGWLRWSEAAPARRREGGGRPSIGGGPIALRVRLDDGSGFDVTEAGTQKRLAVYVVRLPNEVPGIARLGIDPLDPKFTPTRLATLLVDRTDRLKSVLGDQEVIAGVGNAYSDEALHAARMSPYRPARDLGCDEVERLHGALLAVLHDALDRAGGVPPAELKDEKRSSMRVHGRTGLPCPVCSDTVRQVAFAQRSWQYCPTCQTGGKILADRRLSRLLK